MNKPRLKKEILVKNKSLFSESEKNKGTRLIIYISFKYINVYLITYLIICNNIFIIFAYRYSKGIFVFVISFFPCAHFWMCAWEPTVLICLSLLLSVYILSLGINIKQFLLLNFIEFQSLYFSNFTFFTHAHINKFHFHVFLCLYYQYTYKIIL